MIDRYLPKSKWARSLLFLIYDICMIQLSSFLSLWVRFDLSVHSIPASYIYTVRTCTVLTTAVTIAIFALCRLYSTMWGSAGVRELEQIAAACAAAGALQVIGMEFMKKAMPLSYYILWPVFLLLFIGAGRISYRAFLLVSNCIAMKKNGTEQKRIMIVGAGRAGALIVRELKSSNKSEGNPVCIIDDDRNKLGKYINGVPVKGSRENIVSFAEKYSIEEIYIAMPTASPADIRGILEICQKTKCRLKILPGIYQLMNGDVSVSRLRRVELEDLLGREPINVSLSEIMDYVQNQVVLVTGGGGSIGSELCRQLAGHGVKQLIIFDMYENNAYDIQQELKRSHPELDLIVLIGSVRNTNRLNWIFNTYRPDIVYHAAAHKHVPLMEDSPNEAIKNNVIGTYKTAKAAIHYGVKRFILISTDKAVNPTNIMGASKRLCEMVIQMCNQKGATDFVAVRFGNVLGSNGSVIPLFKKQIEEGGPVTVTDPEIIRYFMTIPEAVSLVLQAGAYAKGGEIFILNMGKPVKILDMAENLIRLSGYEPYQDIEIKFTGLRPGEKLYEELLMSEEGMQNTKNDRIFIGKPIEMDYEKFEKDLFVLDEAAWNETADMREMVRKMVPEYHYQKENAVPGDVKNQ